MSKISANELDKKFDDNEDISSYFKLNTVQKVNRSSLVREIRTSLNMTQSQFSDRFHLNIRNVQDWEQGRKSLTPAVQNYFFVIKYSPSIVEAALKSLDS